MAYDGRHVLVLMNMGTTETPDFQVVADQTGFSWEASRNMLDASVKGDRHAKSAYGRMEGTATLDALEALRDGTQEALYQAMVTEEEVVLRYSVSATATGTAEAVYEAPALVGSINRSWPDNEMSTFSASFNLNDVFEEVVA